MAIRMFKTNERAAKFGKSKLKKGFRVRLFKFAGARHQKKYGISWTRGR